MNLNQKVIKPKLVILELAKSLGSISLACKAIGYSRSVYLQQNCVTLSNFFASMNLLYKFEFLLCKYH